MLTTLRQATVLSRQVSHDEYTS